MTSTLSRTRDNAVATLKETLVSRFGSTLRDVVETEVECRLAGRNKLERSDLDAIEKSILVARKMRRDGPEKSMKGLSRSAPNLDLGSPKPSPPSLTSPGGPQMASRVRPPSAGSRASSRASKFSGMAHLARSASQSQVTLPTQQKQTQPINPKKVRQPAPYGTTPAGIDDAGSERSRVQVIPKYPVPKRPLTKPMDHWDLMVSYDAMKHRQENLHFRSEGKHASQKKFKNRLDDQMIEVNAMKAAYQAALDKEKDDMTRQIAENKRLDAAEKKAIDDKCAQQKAINDECMRGVNERRRKQKEREQNEQDMMTKWLNDEAKRKADQDRANAEEYARKCKKANDEREEAEREGERRKKERQAREKAECKAAQDSADGAEAANRAAVQARMDQIERNCQTVGAEIAGRDAAAEAALQAKIKRIQEQADKDAKEDAQRRKDKHDRLTKEMMDMLDWQMDQKRKRAEMDREEDMKQLAIFKADYAAGVKKDMDEAEARRQVRSAQDENFISVIRKNAVIHPRDYGAHETLIQEVAYNRGILEQIASEGFEKHLATTYLTKASHTGKVDPFPSVGRYEGEIHSHEIHHPEVS
eukprot:TRINITY_DN14898_c0_g1_i1.p1 TRINITY_DN14898_c0_g1~~TRINITY_DN14898_c0_g1_i1.p1  ORF type:complete len:587 (+),score=131.78 TRINITY_DN14898_c0_g1_i1:148-1908(+)